MSRPPLVLTAPRRVAETAARLGFERCVERVVEETFPSAVKLDGGGLRIRVDAQGRVNGRAPVGFAITLERQRSPSGRRAWRPIHIERRP